MCVVVCISFPLTKYDFPLDFWISFHLLTLMNFYLMMMKFHALLPMVDT